MYVGHSVRNLKVRVEEGLASEVAAFARRRAISISDAVRLLLRDQLTAVAAGETHGATVAATGLANLLATEQVLKLIESFVPGGKQRSADLAEASAEASRRRLDEALAFLKSQGE